MRRKVMKWFSPIDMEEIRSRESQRRTQPCGEWLLRHEVFQAWLQSQYRAIWISGSPGSGKTVLSTCIIDTVKDRIENDPKQALAFFFCDKSDEHGQSASTIVTSIIGQVLAQLDDIPNHVYAAYNIAIRYGRSKISTSDQPTVILKDLALSLDKLYVVIDGLDELKDAPTVIHTIKDLVNSATMIQVVFLSRRISAISSRLSAFPTIDLIPDVVSSDINNYISRELAELPIRDPGLQNKVFQRLSQSANGMFLWASLMIQTLKLATSQHELVEVLSDLPIGLDTIYSAILNKLAKEPPRRRALAKRVLLLVCCSARPLLWNELECILAFEKSQEDLVESKKPFKSAVLELGGSLIEYLPANDLFRLIHLSVREFLVSSPDGHTVDEDGREFFIQEEVGHSELAEICLLYQIRYGSRDVFRIDSATFPFLEYSTLFWCHHTCHALHDAELERKIEEFLGPQLQRQIWILRFLTWKSSTFPLQYLMKLQKLLQDWIAHGQNTSFQLTKIDWIQDIPSILLCDGDSSFRDEDQSPYNDLNLLKTLMPEIPYFEKLMVIRDLSREYTMRSTLSDGERWLTDALNDQRVRHGDSHISTVWLMNSLGIIYDQQQRVSLSAQIQESALAIQTSVLGPDHLETIWTVNELGRVYRHLNDFDKAESMHQRALTVLRNALHPLDLQIAWTLNTLGRTRRKQRRFDEAIALHNQALDIQQAVLGESHPHTLWATMDKAACYYEQRRLRESEDLYREALEGRERVLGLRNADTFWAMNDLGLVLAELGQMEDARRLQERALSGQIEILGHDHPHTMWTRDILERLSEERSVLCGINAPSSAIHPSLPDRSRTLESTICTSP
jgi:tetratricopeptide (TPR) repeat protein